MRYHFSSYCNQRLVAVLLMSFASGLPLVLIGSTLQAWYAEAGVNLATIGMLTLVGQPYIYKFLWAPLMDRYAIGRLGRRRGWIFVMQGCLAVALVVMAFLNPAKAPWILAGVAFAVAFFSASQDIVIDAYRTDILPAEERGMGSSMLAIGYRLAMLVAGAMALVMASKIGWRNTYFVMAGLMVIEMIVTLWSPSPEQVVAAPKTLQAAIKDPFVAFLKRDYAVWLLFFILIYKLSDAMGLALNTAFLIKGIGFSLIAIGSVTKTVGIVGMLLGSLVGGLLMPALGLFRSLLIFGFLQMSSNLMFTWLAIVGKSYTVMIAAIFGDYFCGGLGTVAFVAFLMSLCNRRFSAAQYALFSAIAAVGRVYVGPIAAKLVIHLGWAKFFVLTFLLGFPALLLLWWLKNRFDFSADQLA